MKNYYQILNISPNASTEEVKKAYRTLSKQYHPDLNPKNKTAEDLFKQINEAYRVLSDENKRLIYDWQLKQKQAAKTTNYSTSDHPSTTSQNQNRETKQQPDYQNFFRNSYYYQQEQEKNNHIYPYTQQKAEKWQYFVIIFLIISIMVRLVQSYQEQKRKERILPEATIGIYEKHSEKSRKLVKKNVDSSPKIPDLQIKVPDLEPIAPNKPIMPLKFYEQNPDPQTRKLDSLKYIRDYTQWLIAYQRWEKEYKRWRQEHEEWQKRQNKTPQK
ncbi:MAG: DnaJ domain-containing protein [Microscillaceae bacterium]|nr:DnaJ domain-containing protein [Microscillaceae bacterium]MDW8460378.1 DnaJ domain-containing protein [Cytophagales bacterium]